MLKTKRIIEMAKKWQKKAAIASRRIAPTSSNSNNCSPKTSSSIVARKGHVYVYTEHGSRFMIPLEYLAENIFMELFKISEEEFGLPTDGPIMLPCNATFLEYIISLMKNRASQDVKKALVTSLASSRCISAVSRSFSETLQQNQILYGF